MFKKFLSIALASIMTMALVVPAFAAESFTETDVSNGDDPEPIEVEAGFADYTLKIAIGGGSALILNPYQLTYDASSFTGGREGLEDAETDQIISNETTIVSLPRPRVRSPARRPLSLPMTPILLTSTPRRSGFTCSGRLFPRPRLRSWKAMTTRTLTRTTGRSATILTTAVMTTSGISALSV